MEIKGFPDKVRDFVKGPGRISSYSTVEADVAMNVDESLTLIESRREEFTPLAESMIVETRRLTLSNKLSAPPALFWLLSAPPES